LNWSFDAIAACEKELARTNGRIGGTPEKWEKPEK
jgi:hypothetical protein